MDSLEGKLQVVKGGKKTSKTTSSDFNKLRAYIYHNTPNWGTLPEEVFKLQDLRELGTRDDCVRLKLLFYDTQEQRHYFLIEGTNKKIVINPETMALFLRTNDIIHSENFPRDLSTTINTISENAYAINPKLLNNSLNPKDYKRQTPQNSYGKE